MNYGMCPSCYNKLTDGSASITKPSEVFRGNNVYMVCKNCQRIVLYNKDRDMIFDLDEFKEDKDVLEEINRLLEDLDPNLEVVDKSQEQNCLGNCSACQGCNDYQGYFSKKEKASQVPQEEPIQEESIPVEEPEYEGHCNEYEDEPISEDDIQYALSNALLAVNKKDVSIKKIFLVDDLDSINVNEWSFFELNPVKVKQKISYEVVRI